MDSKYKELVDNAVNDLKTKGKRHKQIPNILTLMRLTAPLFIIPAAIASNVSLIIGLAIFFSITDSVDGLIARKCNLTSELGELLDAVTDKVFASTLLLATSFTSPILLFNLVLEGIIAGINVYKKKNGVSVKSTLIGKVKTWFLFSLIGIAFVSPYYEINNVLNSLMCATSIMQIFTFISYLNPKLEINKIVKNSDKKSSIVIVSNDSDELMKLHKEKELETDFSSSKIQVKERDKLEKLEAMREFLIAEKQILESKEDTTINSSIYQKSKKK